MMNDTNLVIDDGNTYAKFGIFGQNGKLLSVVRYQKFDVEDVCSIISQYGIRKCLYSSVRKQRKDIIDTLESKSEFVMLDYSTPLPIDVLYTSKTTLGTDRIAGACGAVSLFPNRNVLVVNSGTCTTYDVVNSQGQYVGGAIAPGLSMRLKAMNQMTERLPLVDIDGEMPLIGSTTETAIRCGAVRGVLYEIEGWTNDFKKIYPDLQVLLTGGGAEKLDVSTKTDLLKVPNLILIGLNNILCHQRQ